jgi:hypothetical protein
MKNSAFSLFLLVALFLLPSDLFAVPKKTLTGTIFKDPNGNNRLDANEKGGVASTVWLYRVYPNGSVRRVRRVRTDQVGNYRMRNVPFGLYFLAIRYGQQGLAVRTGRFRVGPNGAGSLRNVPLVNRQTINRYPGLDFTETPDNLNKGPDGPVSPSAP